MSTGMPRPHTGAPRRLGPYRLYGVLGQGGLGPVYLGRGGARRGGRGRTAAVRALSPVLLRDRQVRARLRNVLGTVRSRVTGPYVAPPLDCELDGERPWVATEFVPGPALGRLLDLHGPPPEAVVRALGAALAHGLAELHAAGVVHGALRPGAVLVAADRPRLADCALLLDSAAADDGDALRPADDVAGLGALLARLAGGPQALTGARPEDGRTAAATAGIPAGLLPVLLACLHRRPGARPPANELASWLDPGATARRPAEEWLPHTWLHTIDSCAEHARELGGRRLFGR
ncbi:hypothetical protein V1L54_05115 [Streptomyces sp. TRM 70361]|uniref:hypothetical protein n=1 Tax=Streptomyces sp. TRM 70361 TaxID=3116553 RepID=UPI002E7C2955|nr:hypothetical protein [Streptomyces sp. TRM 70361]MEE1938797.1 hypothetical protein [Streptomyces sp. TRM 70361]